MVSASCLPMVLRVSTHFHSLPTKPMVTSWHLQHHSSPLLLPPDCGAGIGRVSKRLLIPLFSEVDLVEQNATFLEQGKVYLVRKGRQTTQGGVQVELVVQFAWHFYPSEIADTNYYRASTPPCVRAHLQVWPVNSKHPWMLA